jgi:hypothetical protein
MERRWNPIGFVAIMVLLASVSVFAAGGGVAEEQESVSGAVPGKKFCVQFGGVDDSHLALSQRPSSYVPQSGEIDGGVYSETCFDLWYDASIEPQINEQTGGYKTSIETHCPNGTCVDAWSYLASALQSARSGLNLLTDIDFGGVNADSSCAVTFRPLPQPSDYSSGLGGDNHTIKNLCFVLDGISSEYEADYSSLGVGIFASLNEGYVNSVNFENVYIKVNNGEPYYAVPTGVAVGRVGQSLSIDAVTLKNVRVVAAQAGSLAGYVVGNLRANKILGENVDVLAANGTIASSIEEYNYDEYWDNLTIRLGGLVAVANSGASIYNVGVSGLKVHSDVESISLLPEVTDPVCDYDEDPDCEEPPVTGTPQSISGYIGGLVGALSCSDGNEDVYIINTYTTGDISYVDGDYYIGFLAGEMDFGENGSRYAGFNYHYGATDYQAENVAGWLYLDGSDLSSTWINGYGSLGGNHPLGGGYNYRNSISGKIEPTNCNLDNPVYMGPSYGYKCLLLDGSNYGGYVEPNAMKADAFAVWFNGVSDNDDVPYVSGGYKQWSRKNGVNSGFPVFATSELKPIYQINFMAGSEYVENAPSSEIQEWLDAGATQNADGLSLRVYTDYTGKLSNSTWQAAAAEMASENYFWSYIETNGWDDKTKVFSLKTSTVFSAPMDLNLSENFAVPVVYSLWNGGVQQMSVSEIDVVEVTPLKDIDESGYYYMGDPVKTVKADGMSAAPFLAYESPSQPGYIQYYRPEIYVRQCSGGSCNSQLLYLSTDGYGRFFAKSFLEGRVQLTSEDSIYVVYNADMNRSYLGGNLFVADLHGENIGGGSVEAWIGGENANEDGFTMFYPGTVSVSETPSEYMSTLIYEAMESYVSLPYSPSLKTAYPSDFWGDIDDMVGLVAVGSNLGSASSAEQLVETALYSLFQTGLDTPFLTDTLTELESPEEIQAILKEHASDEVSYARFVRMGKDQFINLTNLFDAIESVRNYDASYPVFVGFLPKVKSNTYRVTFDANYSPDNPPFIGATFSNKLEERTYTKGNSRDVFFNQDQWKVYRTDACYSGYWTPDPYDGPYVVSFDELSGYAEEEEFIPFVLNKDGSKSLTLYASWETDMGLCREYDAGFRVREEEDDETGYREIWNNYVIKDNSEQGNIVLQQIWNGDTLRHPSTQQDIGVLGILVPYADTNRYIFQVYADGMPGYELDGDITFSKKLSWDDEPTLTKIKEGAAITIGQSDMAYGEMEFSANYTFKTYNIVFDSERDSVLYGENSPREGVYKLKSEDDVIDLPKWVYTADRCVAGWVPSSISEEMEGMEREMEEFIWDEYLAEEDNWWGFQQFDFELSEMLSLDYGSRAETYSLYGFWVPAKICVQEFGYKQAKLTATNGTVQFKEILKDSDGKAAGSQVHYFAKDGTMLLPSGTKGDNFVVVGKPKSGFVLDSLLMIVKGDTTTYHEGDTLSGDISQASFVAYFVEDNKTPVEFVKKDLWQSGNAVRLEVSTTEFRAGGATLRIVLENDDGKNIVDTLLAEAITKTPYSGEWEYYPLAPGNYLLTATLVRGKESVLFEKDFEVKAEIASVQDSGWHMISLANVDMDSVAWEGDDAKFFWWDETSPFGVIWQYQEFQKGGKVDPLVGYWYNSLSGRPLVTRKAAYAPKNPVVWKLDSLYSGWNMVANPYGWYVDLYGENAASQKDATEKPDVEFLSWNDSLSDYEPVNVVGPYGAVWVQVNGPRTWKLPERPEFVSKVDENGAAKVAAPLKKTVDVGTFGKNRWAIRAVLSDARGKRDGWNILGVSENAWTSEEPPAGMGDRVNLSIREGKKGLSKSFKKAAGDSYEWTVSLDASGNRMGFLHFEGIRALNAEGLKVFVTVDGETTQMNEGDTLKVALGSMAKTATVRVAPSARVTVAQKLNGLRAFQMGNSLQVGFQVSEGLAGSRAYVEILDMKGKVLSSASGTAVSGSNAITLQAPKSGLYMVRVRVGSKQAAGSIAVK